MRIWQFLRRKERSEAAQARSIAFDGPLVESRGMWIQCQGDQWVFQVDSRVLKAHEDDSGRMKAEVAL